MKSNPIDHFLNSRVSWLADTEANDIIISSRIRLARNLTGVPFPVAADNSQLLTVCDAVKAATEKLQCPEKDPLIFVPQTMEDVDRQVLLERRLASSDFIEREIGTILLVSRDESCSIMVNEEDHLRMQVMCPGLNLEKAWSRLSGIDDQLKQELNFAWDDRLGFLTCCPTNVGTGQPDCRCGSGHRSTQFRGQRLLRRRLRQYGQSLSDIKPQHPGGNRRTNNFPAVGSG
jgi:protein arginine kinase